MSLNATNVNDNDSTTIQNIIENPIKIPIELDDPSILNHDPTANVYLESVLPILLQGIEALLYKIHQSMSQELHLNNTSIGASDFQELVLDSYKFDNHSVLNWLGLYLYQSNLQNGKTKSMELTEWVERIQKIPTTLSLHDLTLDNNLQQKDDVEKNDDPIVQESV